MDKLERDGMIAVVVSPGYGAGWSTWNNDNRETLCMDADIAQAVLDGDREKAVAIAKEKCGDICALADDLSIERVNKGQAFEIDEYDGSESLHVIGDRNYMVA